MAKRRYNRYELNTGCAVEACLEVIGGKWKGIILYHLMSHGVLRFSQIQKLKPGLSPRILTAQLRELEKDGVIHRNVFPGIPPRVEYSLASAGESLRPLIKAMQEWGDSYIQTNLPIRETASSAAADDASRYCG